MLHTSLRTIPNCIFLEHLFCTAGMYNDGYSIIFYMYLSIRKLTYYHENFENEVSFMGEMGIE